MKAALSSELIKSHFLGGMIDEELAPETSVFFFSIIPWWIYLTNYRLKQSQLRCLTVKDCRPNPNVERLQMAHV